MGRCGDCKFWGKNIREYWQKATDAGVDQTGEWRQCGFIKHHSDYDGPREGLVVLQDASDFHAALKCRSDFGCILFQPLSQENQ